MNKPEFISAIAKQADEKIKIAATKLLRFKASQIKDEVNG